MIIDDTQPGNESNVDMYFKELITIWRTLYYSEFIQRSNHTVCNLSQYEHLLLITGGMFESVDTVLYDSLYNPYLRLMIKVIDSLNDDDEIFNIEDCIQYWNGKLKSDYIDTVIKHKDILPTIIVDMDKKAELIMVQSFMRRLYKSISILQELEKIINQKGITSQSYDAIHTNIELIQQNMEHIQDECRWHRFYGYKDEQHDTEVLPINIDSNDLFVVEQLNNRQTYANINQFIWVTALIADSHKVHHILIKIILSLLKAVHNKKVEALDDVNKDMKYMWILLITFIIFIMNIIGTYISMINKIEIEN